MQRTLMTNSEATAGGSGPLYPKTPAGMAAAEQPVHLPTTSDDTAEDTTDIAETDHPTGEGQAAANRDNEPPA